MNKICHITTVHHVFDDRIFYKECVSLAKAGFDVTLIAKHNCTEIVDGVKIVALPNKNNRLYRIIFQFIAFFKAVKVNAKIYHFHDPELIFVCSILKILGKKIIYDVHEDIVKQVYYKKWIKLTFVRYLLSKIIYGVEKFCALFFARIVVVTNDIAIKFKTHKTLVICNYPIVELIDRYPPNNINPPDKIILIYVGGLTEIRGITEIISSLDYLKNDVELHLLGTWESDEYMKNCMKLSSWDKVKYYGQLKLEDVYPYIKSSDIGLSMLYPAKNYVTSLPVKAFEYMACQKPMIMSDFDYWKEVFGEVALFCDPKDPKKIAGCIGHLINNRSQADIMAKEGRRLIAEKYSWEIESIKLVEMYRELLSK